MTLRVTLSIIPHGDEDRAELVETLNISNIGATGDKDKCQYVIERNTYKTYDDTTPRVFHYRSEGALELVKKAIEAIV